MRSTPSRVRRRRQHFLIKLCRARPRPLQPFILARSRGLSALPASNNIPTRSLTLFARLSVPSLHRGVLARDAAPPWWWTQVQPVEEGALEDALEVEEEAHPPSSAQAPVRARPPARVMSVADMRRYTVELLRHSPSFKLAVCSLVSCSLALLNLAGRCASAASKRAVI